MSNNINISMDSIFSISGCGNIKTGAFVILGEEGRVFPEYKCTVNESCNTMKFSAEYDGLFRDTLYFNYNDTAVKVRRVFENISVKTFSVKSLGFSFMGITFGKKPSEDFFYHSENHRVFKCLTLTIDDAHKKEKANSTPGMPSKDWENWPIMSRIGTTRIMPFPAILLSNYQTTTGLVHGTLSQDIFYHNYLTEHVDDKIRLEVLSSFKGVDNLLCEPDRVLVDEWYWGKTEHADDIEQIFADYIIELRKKIQKNCGKSNVNRTSIVWGSWNDGIFRDISEDMLLKEAKFIKENFPTVEWIQIDDGYSASCDDIDHGLGVPYEGDEGIDKNKFPYGLRHFTDEIHALGLHPAIWIGAKCPTKTKIHADHPEWFLKNIDSGILDISQEEVRNYIEKALRKLCLSYGFDGIKSDFWSYAYEDSRDFLSLKTKSGYEYRDWYLRTLRSVIPQDGYIQSGSDITPGNPFLAKHVDNYRYGDDIEGGTWKKITDSVLMAVHCYAMHMGDLFIPNSDSIGAMPTLNDRDTLFWINYCLVTHSLVEIAGKLSECQNQNRIKMIKKAICNPNNGQDVFYLQYDYRKPGMMNLPEIIYFKTPHFSAKENCDLLPLRTVGLFNYAEETKEFSLTLEELGLEAGDYTVTNVWTGEKTAINHKISTKLEPHGSCLLAINMTKEYGILDANIRINDISLAENIMFIETDYTAKDVEITLSKKPKKILLDNKEIQYTWKSDTAYFATLEKGKYKIML